MFFAEGIIFLRSEDFPSPVLAGVLELAGLTIGFEVDFATVFFTRDFALTAPAAEVDLEPLFGFV